MLISVFVLVSDPTVCDSLSSCVVTVEADDSRRVACDALIDAGCGVALCDGSAVAGVESRFSGERLCAVASEVGSADLQIVDGIGSSSGSRSFVSSID